MKENISIRALDISISSDNLAHLQNALSTLRFLMVRRSFFFHDQLKGYSLGHAKRDYPDLAEIINTIEQQLLDDVSINGSRVVEYGLAINDSAKDVSVDSASGELLLDEFSHQIRIAITGISTFDNVILEIGQCYLVDSITGYPFSFSSDAIHLVFNIYDKSETRPIWNLWKPKML